MNKKISLIGGAAVLLVGSALSLSVFAQSCSLVNACFSIYNDVQATNFGTPELTQVNLKLDFYDAGTTTRPATVPCYTEQVIPPVSQAGPYEAHSGVGTPCGTIVSMTITPSAISTPTNGMYYWTLTPLTVTPVTGGSFNGTIIRVQALTLPITNTDSVVTTPGTLQVKTNAF